ncbi:hypothetical protein [Stenotrophomonas sp. 278]|uniref:hypothetical protein n=1 Tax=Stenotrophomonas sp. 278 TaxID=2479851 RepID=UPI001639A4B5|nr:hypothetical protein [Stenotrophomonas sp. 278]
MPSLTFPDFEAYSNAVKGVDGEMRVTGRSDAAWVMNTLEIGDVSVLHGMDGAPVTYRGALHAAHFGVYLSLPGSDTELEGERVSDDGYIWMAPRQEMQGFTRVPARFLGVDMAEARVLGQAVRMGLDTQALYRTTHVRSNPQAVGEVVALTQRASRCMQRTRTRSPNRRLRRRLQRRSPPPCCSASRGRHARRSQ